MNEILRMTALDKRLKDWAEMTNRNAHTEVRRQIAQFFNYEVFALQFMHIGVMQEKIGFIDLPTAKYRQELTECMLRSIKNKYSEEIYNKVVNVL